MDKIVIVDFGGQYSHLISRRIRDMNVYSYVITPETDISEIKEIKDLKGLVFSGGAASVYEKDSPTCNKELLELGIPILGICYGHHLIAHLENGKVVGDKGGEYGITSMDVIDNGLILKGVGKKLKVWMNHGDNVKELPSGYNATAYTKDKQIAAYENNQKKIFGVQFHPEVTHTDKGKDIMENYVFGVCNAKKEWTSEKLIEKMEQESRKVIGNRKAIIGLSGGVDSAVASVIINKAIGKNLTAVYVDTGLMRHKETEFIERTFSKFDLDLRIVRESEQFFKELKGVDDPEKKRKAIGKTFIAVFDKVAEEVGAEVLIQGTIYSDRIESGSSKHSSRIKSHHNVGGLPSGMKMEVYEPLREIYKDEVRKLALELKLPDEISKRHVFPGPGLGVRIAGEVTPEKAKITRRASFIVEDEIQKAGLYHKVWMAFAILLPIKSVGVQGDARSYKYPVVIRIIESKDAMTANFSKIPYEILEKISTRITNEIKDVNRVLYDITNKPPGTMEWE